METPRAIAGSRLAAMLVSLALCASAGLACVAEDVPATLVLDREVCAQCRMLISEPGFAAQYRSAQGETFFFDDPGCLLLHRADRPDHEPVRAWFEAADARGVLEWVAAESVGFGESERPTPMGYGLRAELWQPSSQLLTLASALEHVQQLEAQRRGGR